MDVSKVVHSRELKNARGRFPMASRVLVRPLNAAPGDCWEEWYVWSVRAKGRLLCLTQFEPDEAEFPPRSKTSLIA